MLCRCTICKACFAAASKLKRPIEPQICCVSYARNERTHKSGKLHEDIEYIWFQKGTTKKHWQCNVHEVRKGLKK